MKNLFILSILLLTSSLHCFGQDSLQLKRPSYKLTVAVDKTSFYEEDLKATPYVLPDNTIQLYPGETTYIEVEQDKGTIKSMTAVKEINNTSKTLTISFTQICKSKVHESMMLQIKNPFGTTLIYKATIFLFKQKKWVDTNVYPVEAGLAAFETWPDIITSIGVGAWKFQNK